ncbi:MAG: YeaC family protein [Pseudohongiellaceae bacterium]
MSNTTRLEDFPADTPDSVEKLVREITPSVYETLKTAVELGKWEDGNKLSPEQLENCLQVIILYEAEHVAESERTGALLNSNCQSKNKH